MSKVYLVCGQVGSGKTTYSTKLAAAGSWHCGPSTNLTGAFMNDDDFEGTLVLEKLALIGKVDEFFESIDADDQKKAVLLMKRAGVDPEMIAMAVQKMAEEDWER